MKEIMASTAIMKIKHMSQNATDDRVKHVLWTAYQAMQAYARAGGMLTMQRLLPAIETLNKHVLDENLTLPGNLEFKRKTETVCETPAETPARLTRVKHGTMDADIEIDVSDHVEGSDSLRALMNAERQQELLLSEARETLRRHAISSSKKRRAEREKFGKHRIPIASLRQAFGK